MPPLLQPLLDLAAALPASVWVGLSAGSLALALVSVALVPWLLIRLPANILVVPRPGFGELLRAHPVKVALVLLRNALGLVVFVLGLAMLFLPGQGVLSILAGLALVDLPGRQRLVLALLRRPAVTRAVQRLRARAGRPPLQGLGPSAEDRGEGPT